MDNVSISLPSIGTSLGPGDRLGYRYQVAAPAYESAWGPTAIWFPPTQVTFPTTQGSILVDEAGRNLTLTSSNFTGANATLVYPPLTNLTSFRAGAPIIFSTLQVAPMALAPLGKFRLAVQFQWVALVADGSNQSSGWTPASPTSVQPGQYVQVISGAATSVAPGATYTACLAGPLGNRTFIYQTVQGGQLLELTRATVLVPTTFGNPFCSSFTIPSSTALGNAFVRLWSLPAPNVTVLLYSLHLHVGNGTAAAVEFGGLTPTQIVDVISGVGLGVLLSAVLITHYRDRPRGTRHSAGSEPVPSEPASPAGEDPPELPTDEPERAR